MILDVYTDAKTVYIDLNPVNFIELPNSEIYAILKFHPIPSGQKVHRTTEFNVAIFLELNFDELPAIVEINGVQYKVKHPHDIPPVDLQLCLVFKNEWDALPYVMDFYKRVHGVKRFILYDNQSDAPPPAEISTRADAIYQFWDVPYFHTITNKSALSDDYTGPEKIIVAQNSAYSHCLKRYRQAKWTAFLDTDEFVVRRRDNLPLSSIVNTVPDTIDTIEVKGFWAGCNSFNRDEIFRNLRNFKIRSNKFCRPKLILKTGSHLYTKCIHEAYSTAFSYLRVNQGYYFFHLYTASAKLRRCECKTYCSVRDKSLSESFTF
jgi:hypothetical protein